MTDELYDKSLALATAAQRAILLVRQHPGYLQYSATFVDLELKLDGFWRQLTVEPSEAYISPLKAVSNVLEEIIAEVKMDGNRRTDLHKKLKGIQERL